VTAVYGVCETPSAANQFCNPTQPGLFNSPEGIAVDGTGNLYVADAANTRIQKLRAESGQALAVWDMAGRVPGQLFLLSGMSLDGSGNLYVAEAYNHQVVKLDPNGNVVGRWGGPDSGGGPGQFHGPRGVGVDGAGNLFVAEVDNWRVQKLAPDGAYLDQWRNCLIGTVQDCQIPGAGDQPGQFFVASGVAADAQGSVYVVVYVVDTGNKRLQRLMVVDWVLVPPPPTPTGRS
jgi:tripartite motif-containing protein 71